MRIVWTDEAQGGLRGQIAYLAERNREAARTQKNAIQHAVGLLRDYPHRGRPRRRPATRELVIPGTPYLVVYGIVAGTVEIYHVYHGAQNWTEDLADEQP